MAVVDGFNRCHVTRAFHSIGLRVASPVNRFREGVEFESELVNHLKTSAGTIGILPNRRRSSSKANAGFSAAQPWSPWTCKKEAAMEL